MDAKEIGLKEREVKPIVDHLNDLLANYHIHYQRLRGCHWNVKGGHFFTLHVKFEELYTNAQLTIDEIAERVLTLGKPPHRDRRISCPRDNRSDAHAPSRSTRNPAPRRL